MTFPLYLFWITTFAILITLICATIEDIKCRKVEPHKWINMVIVSTPIALYYYIVHWDWLFVPVILSLCAIYYLFNKLHLFGGADSICLILITILMPACPFSTIYFAGLFAVVTAVLSLIVFPAIFYVKGKTYGVPYIAIILVGFVLSLFVAFVLQTI